ncbi:uncharacterized protein BT62DRAFT_921866 [Guyanagaster necrorhizus]|uniref:Uncharacterized protein n=1 Tax=Guyanagaster necrorhizus TaxID=856835 RepID=A0A9P7VMP0_9AGAR|nr:uncharacterized protein BT62DRAFT_921866 [Guyanagaster necrorhizus MCA 3950]KAG7443350.1 hypothetical protein BT62DRAFT_921866 [Guyanagaster necrorhizus MCA 3950]
MATINQILLFGSANLCRQILETRNVTIPRTTLSWKNFSNSRPYDKRVSIAQIAIDTILPQLDNATGEFSGNDGVPGIGYWQSGNVFSVMAIQDWLADTTTNKALVEDNLELVWGLWRTMINTG